MKFGFITLLFFIFYIVFSTGCFTNKGSSFEGISGVEQEETASLSINVEFPESSNKSQLKAPDDCTKVRISIGGKTYEADTSLHSTTSISGIVPGNGISLIVEGLKSDGSVKYIASKTLNIKAGENLTVPIILKNKFSGSIVVRYQSTSIPNGDTAPSNKKGTLFNQISQFTMSRTFSIYNGDTTPLVLNGTRPANPEDTRFSFADYGQTTPIQPQSSTSFTIHYLDSGTSPWTSANATVKISSSSESTPLYTFKVSGLRSSSSLPVMEVHRTDDPRQTGVQSVFIQHNSNMEIAVISGGSNPQTENITIKNVGMGTNNLELTSSSPYVTFTDPDSQISISIAPTPSISSGTDTQFVINYAHGLGYEERTVPFSILNNSSTTPYNFTLDFVSYEPFTVTGSMPTIYSGGGSREYMDVTSSSGVNIFQMLDLGDGKDIIDGFDRTQDSLMFSDGGFASNSVFDYHNNAPNDISNPYTGPVSPPTPPLTVRFIYDLAADQLWYNADGDFTNGDSVIVYEFWNSSPTISSGDAISISVAGW